MEKKTICFDLDDTLCTRPEDVEHMGIIKYRYCTPIQPYIDFCNELYDLGCEIIIYTSRGMTTLNKDVERIEIILRSVTEIQLKEWGVKYHKLIFGKPHYDVIIDDKALFKKIDIVNLISHIRKQS